MKVPQLPVAGALIADEERAGRYLRVSSHPEFDRVVLSVWQHDQCLATVRLDRQSVSDLICGLARALVARPADAVRRRVAG
ncbi:MAG: hypothetical protein M9891_04725 [Austwickia sp.]|nr:hypothetical protein [Actinomycetota bacterium]MCB1252853.1 hypothetical protein [Austwickia sp.]MCO5308583.1 hypothetical protein [Austwickia sp.]